MIKLELQKKLTINDKIIYTEDPNQDLWDNIFNSTGIKCEGELLDEFLKEIQGELQTVKTFQDYLVGNNNESLANEFINKVLSEKGGHKHLSAWVLLMNCGLVTKRETYPSFLTENGQDLLDVLNELFKEEDEDIE